MCPRSAGSPTVAGGLDPEALLAETAWVRSLARRLVREPDAAEDLVQDVWVAALDRPPRAADGPGLRAWLAGVARRLALRRDRDAARRRTREQRAARPEAVRGGSDEVERVQTMRALAESLLALEEPYRTAVLLRHLDGRGAREIARRQGTTPAAARQRVSRGIAMLRARLAAQLDPPDGTRPQGGWCAALTALAAPRAAGTAAVPSLVTEGATIMGVKAAAGALAIGALVLGWVWTGADDAAPRPTLAGAARPADAGSVAPPAGDGTASAAPASGPASPVARSPRAPAPTDEAPARAPLAAAHALAGRVVDVAGRPIVEATVRVVDGEAATTTGAEGRFRLALRHPPADGALLAVTHERYLPAQAEAGAPELSVVLHARPVLRGRLLDANGAPVGPPARVTLVVLDAATDHPAPVDPSVRPDGTFVAEALPAGRLVEVRARARAFRERRLETDLALEPDGVHALDVALERGATVEGVVVDDATGTPIADAEVWTEVYRAEAHDASPWARTGPDGRFRLEGVEPRRHETDEGHVLALVDLRASAPGYATSYDDMHVAGWSEAERYEFEVRLAPAPCGVRGRVLAADGVEPARGALVLALDAEGQLHTRTTGADGRFEIPGLPPGEIAFLARNGALDAGAEYRDARERTALAAGETRDVALVLRPGSARIEGRVTAVDGRPVADARVRAEQHLHGVAMRISLDAAETRTDAEGRYRLTGLPAGEWSVETEAPELPCRRPTQRPVELQDGGAARAVDLRVGPCSVFAGRVAPRDGEPRGCFVVLRDPATGAVLHSTRPAADGAFRIEGVLAEVLELALERDGATLAARNVGPSSILDLELDEGR